MTDDERSAGREQRWPPVRAQEWLLTYAVAAAVFCVVDLVWLTLVAANLYRRLLGDLLAASPNLGAAVLFYALFVGGLVSFVIVPASRQGSGTRAALGGAGFGLVTYATWDLTSLAVLEGFPALIVPIDMAWGACLAAMVSWTTYRLRRGRVRTIRG